MAVAGAATGPVALRVCVVVEATAPMGYYITELREAWLGPIIKGCAEAYKGAVEFGLVQYRTAKFSDFTVQRSKWTSDTEEFLEWMDMVVYTGGAYQPTALAEAFAEVVYMCRLPHNFGNKTLQCHSILMACGEPSRNMIPWPYPSPENIDTPLISYDKIVRQLKPGLNISCTILQGGRCQMLIQLFKSSQGTSYQERRNLNTRPQLYIHPSNHWRDVTQWLVAQHGQEILPTPVNPAMSGAAGVSPQVAVSNAQQNLQQQQQQQQMQLGGLRRAAALSPIPQQQQQPHGQTLTYSQGPGVAVMQQQQMLHSGGPGLVQPQFQQPAMQQVHLPMQPGLQQQQAPMLGHQQQLQLGTQQAQQYQAQQAPAAGQQGQELPFVVRWQGLMSVDGSLTAGKGLCPLFEGVCRLPANESVDWPSNIVISSLVTHESIKEQLKSLQVDLKSVPKLVFIPQKTIDPELFQRLINQHSAATVKLNHHTLVLPFKNKERIIGLLIGPKATQVRQ